MNKNIRNFFKSAKCTLGVWALMFIGLVMLGGAANAQNTKNTKDSKKPQTQEMSPVMAQHYSEYLKRCQRQDSIPCLSPEEFINLYRKIARHSAVDREIMEQIYKIDRQLRNARTNVYGWPGANRNINSTWR